jgi:hypothetical protein
MCKHSKGKQLSILLGLTVLKDVPATREKIHSVQPRQTAASETKVGNFVATNGSKTRLGIVGLRILQCWACIVPIIALAPPLQASPVPSPQDPADNSISTGAVRFNDLLCLTCTARPNGRIFKLIQSHRAAATPAQAEYMPLTVQQKFAIAFRESTDPGTFLLAAAIGGLGQAKGSNPSFGQEFTGYTHYVGTKYADYVISDFMREGIFPSLLHQDPRYFRRGTGSGWSRVAYAARQVFWTRSDSGRMGFNYSQIAGGAAAVAISAAYYPENRDARAAANAFEAQIGAHIASNVVKEFWPDLQRVFLRKHPDNRP